MSLVLLHRKENGVDVGEDTTLGDGHSVAEFHELFVVLDGELKMSGVDSTLLVFLGGVASELDDLGGEVLEDSGQVDGSTGADAVSPVALAEHSVHSADGEGESSSGRAGLFGGSAAFRFSSGHDFVFSAK